MTGPVLAVAYQHGYHICRQAQVTHKAQQDLQFLCGQCFAQQPLDFTVKGAELVVRVHSAENIGLSVLGPLADHGDGFLFRPQAQLPQCGGGAGKAGIAELQSLLGTGRLISALDIQIYQCRIAAGGTEQLMYIILFNI